MPEHRVCPWWLGYLLASPIRRIWQDPHKILSPYVREGMTVLEPGPGMGYFTLELLRLVGASGRVVAVDIQPKMLKGLERRASKAGLTGRLETRLAQTDSMGISDLDGACDFALAFAMVHELPASAPFFAELSRALKPGGRVLLVEPSGHVKPPAFDEELRDANRVGLEPVDRPAVKHSHTALLQKVA